MNNSIPYCILFAGAAGSSKTPIAHYLSTSLQLPIFNNDAVRNEMLENNNTLDEKAFRQLTKERALTIISQKISFIYDASIDRRWAEAKELLEAHHYKYFVISLDLSQKLLEKIYKAKGYTLIDNIAGWKNDHDEFVKNNENEISLHITDEDFPKRLELSLTAIKKWISNHIE